MKSIFFFLPCAMLIAMGCNSHGNSTICSDNNIMRYSRNISIDDLDDCSIVKIRNPWDTTKLLASYYLVPRDSEVPAEFQDNSGRIVRIPLKDAVVYSNIYISLLKELGHAGIVKGVCDADYITDSLIIKDIDAGLITNCGLSTAPNIEKIMSVNPEAIILSPMDNSNGHGKLDNIGITLVEGAEYTEETPLARAEWMRFFGRLVGERDKSDSLFNEVEKEYNLLKATAHDAVEHPKVIMDGIYGNQWNVPTSRTVTGNLISDAGGVNIFSNYNNVGSAHLSPEEVILKGSEADVWFVRYYSPSDYSLTDWLALNKSYSQFKPTRNGKVYGSNTSVSGIFDDAAFHPQWILADMVSILHPELTIESPKKYYYRLK